MDADGNGVGESELDGHELNEDGAAGGRRPTERGVQTMKKAGVRITALEVGR